ncbi:hypothetical protein GCM10023238_00530 [Streptomyces heliomycini]
MINTYDHPDAEASAPLRRGGRTVVSALLERARRRDVPGDLRQRQLRRVRSHHGELLDKALSGPHARLVEPLVPDDSSLFVVKARHSIFFETPLGYLLNQQGIDRLVLCGQVTEQCVLYSSLDAHIPTST